MDTTTSASVNSPRVLVIGATGPTGMAILQQLRAANLHVRALARKPQQLPPDFPAVDVVKGDVLDKNSLLAALSGVDVVISSLGTPLLLKPVTLLSAGTTNLVQAMRQSGVARLLCITGMGAGDSRGHGGFVYDWLILPTLLRYIYADKDRQEQVVRDSGLDWVLVRPAMLTNGEQTGHYREITRFGKEQMGKISRQDVAHFMVQELLQNRYHQQSVNLSY